MANTVSCPDLALENVFEIDTSEDPTAALRLFQKKISFSRGSRPAVNEKSFKPYVKIERKPFSDLSYAVQLRSGSNHLKLH